MLRPISRVLLAASLCGLSACLPERCGRPAEVRDAPTIVATATLDEGPFLGGHRPLLSTDGGLVVVEKKAVAAFDANGKKRWRRALDHGDWIVPLADGGLLVADNAEQDLLAIDPATGADRWRVSIPRAPDSESSNRSAEGAARVDGDALVALADGRFLRVHPTECRSTPTKCLSTQFTLKDETLSDPTLAILSNGDLILGESGLVRHLSPTGEMRAAFRVRDGRGDVAVGPSGRLAIVMDEELVLFDLARCATAKPIVLPRKPNKLHIRGEGECEECIAPPSGCVIARPALGDVDSTAPLIASDGAIIVNDEDGMVKVSFEGKKLWQSEIRAFGRAIEVGQDLVAMAVIQGKDFEETPARVVALDPATGKVRWSRTLPATKTGALFVSTDETLLAAEGATLIAGYKTSVSWLRLQSPVQRKGL